jgi:hypothetical protein
MANDRLQQVLQGKEDNYLLPFFWLHGEKKEVVEEYIETKSFESLNTLSSFSVNS